MEEAHLKRLMSKKSCFPDNSAYESFFGRMKNKMFYDCNDIEEKIKVSLDGLSPMKYKHNLEIA